VGDVASLEEIRQEPHPDVVQYLTDLLEEAKAGRVRGVACAATLRDGHTISAWEPGDASYAELYLAIERLRVAMLE